MSWTPASWRDRPAAQQPLYPDALALETAQSCLRSAAPLVRIADIRRLEGALASVAKGDGILLQAGDCAETFAEFGADKVRTTFNLLLQMAAILAEGSGGPVVKVGRIAGQFAKPRSADLEKADGVSLPVYRGDIVNAPAFEAAARMPDPMRMLEAHRQSKVTVELLSAYSAAAYADLSDIHRAARQRLGLRFEHAAATGDIDAPVDLYTSHEALLLPYEEALTRRDEAGETWWARSAHMLWLGDRTRQLDGAHVEYASGIANPIGIKCGPSMQADDLLRLIDRIDPANRPGRMVLIGRFGAEAIRTHLPALMRATHDAGRSVIWAIDPMHGNTVSVGGRKTRLVSDIVTEMGAFFDIATAEGVHPGGVHLELTGADVTECLGGSAALAKADLERRYLTHCDPRLNASQSLDVAAAAARLLAKRPRTLSTAA